MSSHTEKCEFRVPLSVENAVTLTFDRRPTNKEIAEITTCVSGWIYGGTDLFPESRAETDHADALAAQPPIVDALEGAPV